MNEFNLQFTKEQVQIIINALAQRPYGEVVGIMAEMQRQLAPPTGPGDGESKESTKDRVVTSNP